MLLIAPFGLSEVKLKSKAKVTPYNFAQMKSNFLADTCAIACTSFIVDHAQRGLKAYGDFRDI